MRENIYIDMKYNKNVFCFFFPARLWCFWGFIFLLRYEELERKGSQRTDAGLVSKQIGFLSYELLIITFNF